MVAASHRLRFQVNRYAEVRMPLQRCGEFSNVSGVNYGWQETILDAVLRKDIAKRRRDDGSDAVIQKGIRCRLTRRSSAEICAADKDPGIAPFRPIERKIRTLPAVGIQSQVMEQKLAEPRGSGHLEKPRGQQLVGID